MSAVTQLATWAVYVGSIGSPVAAFLAVLFGNWVTRRGQRETETRSRREQVMTTLQWAAELAISNDAAKAALGVAQLNTLAQSNLSDDDVQKFVDSALDSVVDDVADEIDESESEGEAVAVIRLAGSAYGSAGHGPTDEPPVLSEDDQDDGGDLQ